MHKNVTSNKEGALAIDLTKCHTILSKYNQATSADLIPILQQIQNAYGYLPQSTLEEITARARIPLSKIYPRNLQAAKGLRHMRPLRQRWVRAPPGRHIKGAP